MEEENQSMEDTAMTFDEISMEQSMSFVKALQELKNLRPQLYSAAEYCEKSYLHSEQKQMVVDNLKDYAVRALVNAVDHLGTVAYKLSDLLDQQSVEISTMELNVLCLNQRLMTCQTYTDKEALRQQQLLGFVPRHHKHYILPNSVSKKVHFSPQVQPDAKKSLLQIRSRQFPSGTPAANTLSWHLASETKSTLKGTPRSLSNGEEGTRSSRSSSAHHQFPNLGPASSAAIQALGVARQDPFEGSKPVTPFRSFDNPRREIVRAAPRSKSVLSAFFAKPKASKLRTSAVS